MLIMIALLLGTHADTKSKVPGRAAAGGFALFTLVGFYFWVSGCLLLAQPVAVLRVCTHYTGLGASFHAVFVNP
jgi:hypothetical protein